MNATDLFSKLNLIRASPLDDVSKCRQAIDAIAGELKKEPAPHGMPGEVKRQLLWQLDDLYARALRQWVAPGDRTIEDQRLTRR